MSAEHHVDEKAIFNEARQISDAQAREAFVRGACGDNAAALQRIRDLLAAHAVHESFLESPPHGIEATRLMTEGTCPVTERAGDMIGPYKLLQRIGEGGMGIVYMAEQTEPVERRVALKVIKPGMDSQQVVARFEAERQALAMMDHPNIAKVFDAATTVTGRPYFVMELVKGVPVTQYCDEQHLTPRERLELFLPICHAVQHAHQKGIIHRDLKPSNILVAQYDDHAVPKVIDFGVAKAISQKLTEKTMFTQYGQIVGTVEYMSPEQARFNQLDVDTRSDVYSLGVLLYELLTGETPFDKQRMRSAAFDELLRIIREEEPPRPSIKLSSCATLPSIAANRKTEPGKLSLLMRGELDWIVMKAMEKDRTRRYETANQFASDIQHYLADEAVLACPPSAAYRFQKFVRRNRGPMTIASLAAAALIVVAIGSAIAASRFRALAQRNAELLTQSIESEATARDAQQEAENARDKEQELRAEAERQTDIAQQQTERAEVALADAQQQRQRAEDNFTLARSAVDEFLNRVTENELLTVPGMQSLRRELLTSALEFYDNFAQDEANTKELQAELATAHYRIAVIRGELGQSEESAAENEFAIELYEQLLQDGSQDLGIRLGLAKAVYRQGRFNDVVSICQAILTEEATHAETRSLLAETYNSLAVAKNTSNADALAYHQKALQLRESLVQEFPDNAEYLAELGSTLNNIGVLLSRQDKDRDALAMYERAIEYKSEAYNKTPHAILWGRWLALGLKNVAVTRAQFGEHEQALAAYQRVVAVRRKLAFDNPAVASLKGELYKAWMDLGNYQQTLGNVTDAGHSFRRAEVVLEQLEKNTPTDSFNLAIVYGALATPTAETTDEPDEAAQAGMQRYADLAMQTLEQAVAGGFRDLNQIRNHESLAVIRARDRFQQLLIWLDAETLSSGKAVAASEQVLKERQKAVAAQRKLIEANPEDLKHRTMLAVSLHAVALTEIELRLFDAAKNALAEERAIREKLYQEEPESSQHLVDLGAVSVALGDLYWKSSRAALARRHWKTGLEVLSQAASLALGDKEIANQIARQELVVFRRYGEAGLWDWAAEYCERVLKRGSSYDSSWDFRLAHVLAATKRFDEHTKMVLLLSDKWSDSNPDMVLWAAAMSPRETLDPATLVTLAERSIASGGDTGDAGFRAAHAYYRAGQYDRALELMSKTQPRDFIGPHYRYGYAMVDHKLGERERAESMLEQGEIAYRDIALRCLQGPAITGVSDGHYGYWYAWAEDQAIRRLAWNEVRGHDPPDDPWQHLIQARAYQTIGEADLAATELVLAESAAPGNNEAELAHQGLVAQWENLGLAALEQRQNAASEELESLRDLTRNDPASERHQKTLAASLHSVGEVQIGLKQYDEAEQSLEEAMRILRELSKESPGDASTALDLLATQYALGRVYWESDRHAEAHRRWQEVMAELDKLSSANHDNQQVLKSIANIERNICDAYGRLGLWSLAAEYPQRNMRHGRMNDLIWDSRFAPTILMEGSIAGYEKYCRQYDQHRRASLAGQGSVDQKYGHLIWACALSENPPIDVQELIELGQRASASASDHPFWEFPLALLQCRAGDASGADQTFFRGYSTEPSVTGQGFSKAYLEAMLESALSHPDRAESLLLDAERAYTGICQATLKNDPPESPGWVGKYWWELAYTDQLRIQAWKTIRGTPPPHTAWRHVLQAAGYHVIGEAEKADAELVVSRANASGDADVAIAHARLLGQWGEHERAEVEWQRVVDLAGDDPMPWIQRGRWYVEQGKNEMADQDFAKAASLAPNELHNFLDAGWWVVGPYPTELDEVYSPEIDADPSKPVFTVDPKTGLSEQPTRWWTDATEEVNLVWYGHFDKSADDASKAYYGLTYVYSPEERPVLLRLAGDEKTRIWLNGNELLVEKGVRGAHVCRVPVVLKPGRNELLVRGPRAFRFYIGDEPLAQAFDLLEQARWSDATLLLKGRSPGEMLTTDPYHVFELAMGSAAAGNQQTFHGLTNWLGDHLYRGWHLSPLALAPNTAFDAHADEIVQLAREMVNAEPDQKDVIYMAALVHYRAGRLSESQKYLDRILEGGWAFDKSLPLRALVCFKQGDPAGANRWLAAALERFDNLVRSDGRLLPARERGDFDWPNEVAFMCVTLGEAQREITGTDDGFQASIESFEQRQRDYWDSLSPDLAVFDFNVFAEFLEPSLPYIVRGMRLAELGQLDDAMADLDRAVSLGPDEYLAPLTRGQFRYAAGDIPGATDDLFESQRIAASIKDAYGQYHVEAIIRMLPEVLDEYENRGRSLWGLRGERAVIFGDWEEANRCFLKYHQTSWRHCLSLASIDSLQKDAAGHAAACKQLSAMIVDQVDSPLDSARFQVLALGLSPVAPADADHLLSLAQQAIRYAPKDRDAKFSVGLAHYRRGEFFDALPLLVDAAQDSGWGDWEARKWPVLAMTHFQLGNEDEAQKWLRRCHMWVDLVHKRRVRAAAGHPEVLAGMGKSAWTCAYALTQEAMLLIEGKAPDPFSSPAASEFSDPRWLATVRFFDQTERLIDAGETDQAIERLTAVIDGGDPFPAAFVLRAKAYEAQSNWQAAANDIQQAIDLGSSQDFISRSATQFTQRLHDQGELGDACLIMDLLIEEHSKDVELRRLRAEWAKEQQDWEKMLEHCNVAIRLSPKQHWLYSLRAAAHEGLGNLEAALEDCNTSLNLKGDDQTALLRRSSVYLTLGRAGDAIDDATRGIVINPNRQWAWLRFGLAVQICSDMDKLGECIDTLTAGLGSDDFLTDKTQLWFHYGVALLANEELPKYQQYCQQILEKVAQSGDQEQFEALVLTITTSPKSVADWESMLKLLDRFPEASLNARTKLLTRAGHWEDALAVRMELMSTRKPDNPNPFDNLWLGLIEQGRGNPNIAREQLKQAKQVVIDHPHWASNRELPLLEAELEALLK